MAVVQVGQGGRNGRVRRFLYGSSRADVARRLAEALRAIEHGAEPPDERLTVATFLATWSTGIRPTVRARTWRSYDGHVRHWLTPELGPIALARLGPIHVRRLLTNVVARGRSAATATRIHATLRAALGQALRDGLILRNVAELVAPPRSQPAAVTPMTAQQARTFLATVAGDRLEALYVLACATGLRQGEILGLRWVDVDLESATATVAHELERLDGEYVLAETKSRRLRVVPLPIVLVAALREHRRRQLTERLAAGRRWRDVGLVFTTRDGQPLNGSTVTHAFQRHLVRAGLPRQRFYDLRHFAGTAIVAGTGDLRLAQEVLGHSSPTLTANVYAHVLPEHRRRAARAIDEALAEPVDVTVDVHEVVE